MSALSIAFNRKRRHFPDLRDSSSDSESEEYPPRKRHKDAEFPVIVRDKLHQLSRWFFDINLNKFARMALLSGTTHPRKEELKNVSEEEDEEEDDEQDDNDSDIQEIKENISQEKSSPLVIELEKCNFFDDSMQFRPSRTSLNGSVGLHYKSPKMNGASARDLRTRYHGTTNCNIRREKTENLKRRPLISDPPTEIEVILGREPEVITVEGDGIEILSESLTSKQKRAHKNWEKLPAVMKQTHQSPKQANSSAQTKSCLSASRSYTANEVVRLQEKAQYKLLLQKYISGPQYHPVCKKPLSNERNKEDSRLFSNSHFKKKVLEQPVDRFIEKYYPKFSPKVKKSDENKEEPPEIIIDDDEDEDVEVIDMKLPKCKSVFQSDLLTEEWFKELKRNVQAQTEERNKIVEDYEQKLEQIKKKRLLHRIKVDSTEEVIEPEFPELTPEMEEAIDTVLYKGQPQDFICHSINNNNLIRKDFDSLDGTHWLNDAVINSYFDLIVERSKKEGYPSVYAFNTFFYGSLKGKGYSAVRRWTRKIDIFSYDLNFVPIHLTFHWCLAVIDHRSKTISYYDSMGTGEEDCLDILHEYLCLEYKDKKGQILDPSTYVTETMKDIPQQMNGSDCGMFTLKYAEYIAKNAEITFDQSHMNYFRRRTIYELLTNQLL